MFNSLTSIKTTLLNYELDFIFDFLKAQKNSLGGQKQEK